jgi:LysR family transcriptional activator of nhaA
MEWLNYHHLLYFWTVAKEGGLKPASEKLRVSQPSISAQISVLEAALGEKLFRPSGRSRELTEVGHLVFGYAEEIFALGRELLSTVKQRPSARRLRLNVGIADSLPKLVTSEILKPAFAMEQAVHVSCREGKVEDLLAQMASHRLDMILADEPASPSLKVKTFNHLLGESGVSFCAESRLARKLRPGFPGSLSGAPALLPAENTAPRRSLEQWFQDRGIQPRIVAEFDDAALMKVMAAEGMGFLPIPTAVVKEALGRYQLHIIGEAAEIRDRFYLITAERRITHPAVVVITHQAPGLFKG